MTTAVLIWLACSAAFFLGWTGHAWMAKRRFVTEPVSAQKTPSFIDLRDEPAGVNGEAASSDDLGPEDAHAGLRLRR